MSSLAASSRHQTNSDTEEHHTENNESDWAQNSNSESDSVKDAQNRRVSMMLNNFLHELAIFLFLIVTYVALVNVPPKVSKSPAVFPFFPQNTIITDWSRGQLNAAVEKANENDISFIMYYAPWDAESQAIRSEFLATAKFFNKKVYFAAINCWQPESECRAVNNKIYSWPVLVAYPINGVWVQYRGPKVATYMMKFLQHVIKPFERVSSERDILQLRSLYDAVVIGEMDTSPGNKEYGVLYTAALRFLERDPLREVGFGVLSEKGRTPLIKLYLWNETLIYPEDKEWKSDLIITWINAHIHQVTIWASPPGGKSQSLAPFIESGPTLLLFTPRNPLQQLNDYYKILHMVSLEYFNCNKNKDIKVLLSMIKANLKVEPLRRSKLEKTCLLMQNAKEPSPVVSCDIHHLWKNSSKDPRKDLNNCHSIQDSTCQLGINFWLKGKNIFDFEYLLRGNTDSRSPQNLKKDSLINECEILNLAKTNTFIYSNFENSNFMVEGLACEKNRSITFLALDSTQFHYFAEGLGVDVLSKEDKTTAVIIDSAKETHYVMDSKFNDLNLKQFISNFTSNTLSRTLGSSAISKRHTHHYTSSLNCQSTLEEICIEELSTSNFLPKISQRSKTVLVFFHSSQCAFCSGISHALLTVAKIFKSLDSLAFYRINGDQHSLPWEYTMHFYPTLLLFPSRRKEESRVFPQNVPMTTHNIISFILSNLDSNSKLYAMWLLCNESSLKENFNDCIYLVRIEILSLIEKTLREYRHISDDTYRLKVFKRLQALKQIQLLSANSVTRKNQDSIESLLRVHLQMKALRS